MFGLAAGRLRPAPRPPGSGSVVSSNGSKSTLTLPVNEPMSTVCSDPFATEPPPTESAASLDAVTAPGAS